MYKIGIGYDIHRLVEERKLFIGGVEIPYVKGLLGHSDGDVLLHAVCDALLGAIGAGDIGEHFPDSDPQYQGVASGRLLEKVMESVKKEKLHIENIDTIVIAQEPLLLPFKKQMQERIAEVLGIKKESVNVKAKTNEGVGEIGNKEAIAAYVVVMLSNQNNTK